MHAADAFLRDVSEVVFVDNTPGVDNTLLFAEKEGVSYIPMHENTGIAAAQNAGIMHLIGKGMKFILFSDQDSGLREDTLANLMQGYNMLSSSDIAVAAVGTRPYNAQTGVPYPPKSKETGEALPGITECYSVISSVSLIPIASLLTTGGFDEALFIDGVDHEWCWRAWHSGGLRSFIVENARIDHTLGEGDRNLAGRRIAISAPMRTYYQFRNYLWLCRRNHVPRFWKRRHLLKYAIKAFYYPIFKRPRHEYASKVASGIRDGLTKKYNPNPKVLKTM